jgi:integrase
MTKPSEGKKHKGTVTKRTDGRYMFRVMLKGVLITTYGKTESEARAKAYERIPLLGKSASGVKFTELVTAWTEHGYEKHGLKPATFDQYRYLVQARALDKIGNRNLESLIVDDFESIMQLQTGSVSTRRSLFAGLIHMMNFGLKMGWVGRNVLRDVPRPKSAQSPRRDISTDEALRLLKAAQGHRWEICVWLGLGAGLRRGEMLGLRWVDVDMATGIAHITGNVTRTSAGLRRGDPKSKNGVRRTPLPPEVMAALKAHRKTQAEERLKAGSAWVDSGMILTNELGGFGEPRNLSRVWRSWATTAGLEDKGTHVGRHFAASTLVASGMASIPDIAAMLGHDPSVLLTIYAAPTSIGQQSAAGALGAILKAK